MSEDVQAAERVAQNRESGSQQRVVGRPRRAQEEERRRCAHYFIATFRGDNATIRECKLCGARWVMPRGEKAFKQVWPPNAEVSHSRPTASVADTKDL